MLYTNDFTYYYFDSEGNLQTAPSAMSVPEEVEDFCKIHDAIGYVQKLGCAGMSQHSIRNDYHKLCLSVLKIAVEKYGETFPVLLRGVRSDRPDSDHMILFGTTDRAIAEFYGKVGEYRHVKGLKTRSVAESVVTGEVDQMDEEIIFFPN